MRVLHKLTTSGECHYCDYGVCRKGHRCRWYKRFVKSIGNKGKRKYLREEKKYVGQ